MTNVIPFTPRTPPQSDRPSPPAHMTSDQAEVWRQVVAAKPADYFASMQPVLGAYCCAVATIREIQPHINGLPRPLDTAGLEALDLLLGARASRVRSLLRSGSLLGLRS